MYLDGIIGADDVRTGWDIRVGNKCVAALVVEGYPGYSYPGSSMRSPSSRASIAGISASFR